MVRAQMVVYLVNDGKSAYPTLPTQQKYTMLPSHALEQTNAPGVGVIRQDVSSALLFLLA